MGTEDSVWIFDSLVGFLNGPIWQAPIQTFIEENCHAFESHMVVNQPIMKKFEEYRNLVDLMLGSYMDDIGITPQQFEEACSVQNSSNLAQHFDYTVFEQIWAANDFELFKRMMIQRNLEIQLQTLQIMNQSSKELPKKEVDVPIATTSSNKLEDVADKEKKKDIFELPPLKLPEDKGILEKIEIEGISSAHKEQDSKKIEELENELISLTSASHTNKVSSVEIQKRQEYLRAQRDKLVALKKAERKKKLSIQKKEDVKQSSARPKSARAAESLLTGSDAEEVEQQLKIRKNLAQRFRKELINTKD